VAYALERYLDIEEVLGLETSFHNPIQGITVSNIEEVDRAVYALRQAWELGMNALPNLMETMEDKGIKLVGSTVDPDFDALACRVNGKLPLIAVHKALLPEEKRLAILRELGHLLLDFAEGMNEMEVERLCLDFAAALLMPFEAFSREMGTSQRKGISISELVILKETYGIPLGAITDRALGLGSIGQREHKGIKKYLRSNPLEMQPYPGKEESNRFKRLVLRATSEGLISISDATCFLNVPIAEFEKEYIVP